MWNIKLYELFEGVFTLKIINENCKTVLFMDDILKDVSDKVSWS